jgi:hypothetical protein
LTSEAAVATSAAAVRFRRRPRRSPPPFTRVIRAPVSSSVVPEELRELGDGDDFFYAHVICRFRPAR